MSPHNPFSTKLILVVTGCPTAPEFMSAQRCELPPWLGCLRFNPVIFGYASRGQMQEYPLRSEEKRRVNTSTAVVARMVEIRGDTEYDTCQSHLVTITNVCTCAVTITMFVSLSLSSLTFLTFDWNGLEWINSPHLSIPNNVSLAPHWMNSAGSQWRRPRDESIWQHHFCRFSK